MDDTLVAEAVRLERAAVSAVLVAVRPRIRRLVVARLADAGDDLSRTDDVCQAVLLAALERISTLRVPTVAGLMAFLTAIVGNKVVDLARDRARHPPYVPIDGPRFATGGSFAHLLVTSATSPSSAAARSDEIRRARALLATLPVGDREVLEQVFLEQLETCQIAQRLGISREAAAMRVLRATRSLAAAAGKAEP
jgi:RNA polymerase sigma-70 factor (ECF subfamily)